MKQIITTAGGGGGDGFTGLRRTTEDEVEVAEILLSLPKTLAKSELMISRYSFTWGRKKKRSVLVSKSESSPTQSIQPGIVESSPEKVTADKSPSTPLCFLSSGSGSDGVGKRKPTSVKKILKKKATDELIQTYNKMQQEREIILRETKAMRKLHQGLTTINMELKAIKHKVNSSRNTEEFKLWNNSLKLKDQQSYHHHHHPQITIFAPPFPPPQHHHHRQQLVAVPCSGNSHGGARFELFNQIDPRVKIHGESYDFMGSSQPLDQGKYLMTDSDPRVRNAAAAAARKRRIMRMKENKSGLLAMKLSRGCR